MRRATYLMALVGTLGAALARAADAPAELPLPTQLRELDRDYANGLESLLTKAKVQDDKALIEDIQARLAVTKQYRTTIPKREVKTLILGGSLYGEAGSGSGELILSRRGIEWRDVHGVKPIMDMTLNDIAWEPKWDGPRIGWWWDPNAAYPLPIDQVMSIETRGQITAKKIDRGPGKTAFRIARPDKLKDNEPVRFRLRITYLPPPTAENEGAK